MMNALALLVAVATSHPTASPCNASFAFTGTICTPATTGRHPAIVLLGGSEGGDVMSRAAPEFAAHGYVAASVAYFGAPGLPQTLENIPVETVGNAVQAIASRPDVDPERIAIMGASKGGELALLVASLYPQIHAVVAVVPSPFAWQGIAHALGAPTSSWTYESKPLPYVAYSAEMGQLFGAAFTTHAPLDLRKGYEASMRRNGSQVAPAMFRLENIKGPILFIAADDDQIWNSVAQSHMALTYLHEHNHPYADRLIQYPNAGHAFLYSSAKRPLLTAPMGPFTLMLGGTPSGNTKAATDAWPKILSFLSTAL